MGIRKTEYVRVTPLDEEIPPPSYYDALQKHSSASVLFDMHETHAGQVPEFPPPSYEDSFNDPTIGINTSALNWDAILAKHDTLEKQETQIVSSENKKTSLTTRDIKYNQVTHYDPDEDFFDEEHNIEFSRKIEPNQGGQPFTKPGNQALGSLPPGFQIFQTPETKIPFAARADLFDEEQYDIRRAKNEYVHEKRLGLAASHRAIEARFGVGYRLYFDFVAAVLCLNGIIFLLQLGLFVAHTVTFRDRITILLAQDFKNIEKLLWASDFDPSFIWVWRGINFACIGLSLIFPVFFDLIARKQFHKRHLQDEEESNLTKVLHFDKIPKNFGTKAWKLVLRRAVSVSIFVFVLLFMTLLTTALTAAQNLSIVQDSFSTALSSAQISISEGVLTILYSSLLTIGLTIANTTWSNLVGMLTKLEKWTTWSAHRKWGTLKHLFFKLFMVSCTMFTKGFLTYQCIISAMGMQSVVSLTMDLTIFNVIEFVIPMIIFFIKRTIIRRKHGGEMSALEEEIRPQFELTPNYIEIIYRQYVIFMGMAASPLVSLLAFVVTGVEYMLDKFSLTRMSRKPPRSVQSNRQLVTFFSFAVALVAMFNLGSGSIYLLSGLYWCNSPTAGISQCLKDGRFCSILANQCLMDKSSNPNDMFLYQGKN